MARPPRNYRAPLVITLAASLGSACGEPPAYIADNDETGGDGPGSGGLDAGSGGTDTSSGGLYQGSGGLPGSGGFLGSGGNPPKPEVPACADDPYYAQIECAPSEKCSRTLTCTSGVERAFVFTCDESGTTRNFDDPTCTNPFEFCEGGEAGPISCAEDGLWRQEGVGGNPPAPCPEVAPTLGAACSAGNSFGTDRSQCGYMCESGDWTIIGCQTQLGADPPSATWRGDGACAAAGGDAAGESD
jgi:hypothetical protein